MRAIDVKAGRMAEFLDDIANCQTKADAPAIVCDLLGAIRWRCNGAADCW